MTQWALVLGLRPKFYIPFYSIPFLLRLLSVFMVTLSDSGLCVFWAKIEPQTFRVSLIISRIEEFFVIVEDFLSSTVQSVQFWKLLLGLLTSLLHLGLGGQLRMRILQLSLERGWFFVNISVLVRCLSPGVARSSVSPACVRLLMVAWCFSPSTAGSCWLWRGFFLSSGGF